MTWKFSEFWAYMKGVVFVKCCFLPFSVHGFYHTVNAFWFGRKLLALKIDDLLQFTEPLICQILSRNSRRPIKKRSGSLSQKDEGSPHVKKLKVSNRHQKFTSFLSTVPFLTIVKRIALRVLVARVGPLQIVLVSNRHKIPKLSSLGLCV